ncbi:4'-phosphopantetheinyl transferase family protein [Streptomyces apocyni]|uniref:4'-phosphopantetheinyl transferase family protein n=1 Tax=Streptomyces apocyni TaxID=2654677 RepID=UPI001E507A1D|nr:4'-phosphopantetheinyl transferase superfamily protein [Streptomyces apocyni]
MTVLRVAHDVWALARTRVGGAVAVRPVRPVHPDDAVAAAGMAGWRAAEFLAGRAVLRELLSAVAPEAAEAKVRAGAYGKPGLEGFPGIAVSVAHDRDTVTACAARGPAVGVDVQRAPGRLDDAVVRRCLRGRSDWQAVLDALPGPERAREFAWIWTAQEACVKAEGLARGPWTVGVPPGRHTGTWRGLRWRSLRSLSRTPLSCAWKEPS